MMRVLLRGYRTKDIGTQRTATPPARRRHLQKNTTQFQLLAARRWLPQALVLST